MLPLSPCKWCPCPFSDAVSPFVQKHWRRAAPVAPVVLPHVFSAVPDSLFLPRIAEQEAR